MTPLFEYIVGYGITLLGGAINQPRWPAGLKVLIVALLCVIVAAIITVQEGKPLWPLDANAIVNLWGKTILVYAGGGRKLGADWLENNLTTRGVQDFVRTWAEIKSRPVDVEPVYLED